MTDRETVFDRARKAGYEELAALRAATECLYSWQGGALEVISTTDVAPATVSTLLSGPLEKKSQVAIAWLGEFAEPLPVSAPNEDIRHWCARAAGLESRPEWWSLPLMPQVLTTSRAVGEGSLSLFAPEDDLGRLEAQLYQHESLETDRVYEISSPSSWCALVDAFPLDVTASRRNTWGEDQRWLLPNWNLVASEFDVVHLTSTGYLETAGLILPVREGATMLAGWGPDESVWLREATIDRSTAIAVVRVGSEWKRPNRFE
ncbi:hypothetical protein [Curtobacterium sp. VKM Ac-1393]|uniref:hypothetical protein n=1 Tax=Curtobacterium sp. VKM Ac-1393 TaxID=2783814 RepID=UPI00188B8EB6|nr:hypothetical protein [Curtobacterium sp. VKM Ac-1393]MBF4609483.1 hypothetical protein [Curtobacterium sp. VKM Ac-1393]